MFFVFGAGAVGSAFAVVGLRSPFYSVLALVVHLVMMAGLFLLLQAEFLAAAQVVVYAGAVMVLYVFVSAYIGDVEEGLLEPIPGQRILGPLFAVAIFAQIVVAVVGSGLAGLAEKGGEVSAGYGTPAEVGTVMLEKFVIVFEGASVLLLLAAVAAVMLAQRRRDTTAELEHAAGLREPEGTT